MNRRYINLIIIVILIALSLWAVLPNEGLEIGTFTRSMQTVQGLDLRGGLQGLLEVDLPADRPVTAQNMEDARLILENRVNGLGLSEANVQIAGDRRMVVEIPGETDPEAVIGVIKETGLLEFVDLGSTQLEEGTIIVTSLGGKQSSPSSTPTVAPTAVPTAAVTPGGPTPTAAPTATPQTVWPTLITGDQLETVSVSVDELGKYQINFELKSEGATKFAEYTRNNVGKILAIVLDKRIISAPGIQSAIPDGKGRITGAFTYDEILPRLRRELDELIEEFGQYKWRSTRDGEVLDEPLKFRDHGIDAARYYIGSRPEPVTTEVLLIPAWLKAEISSV